MPNYVLFLRDDPSVFANISPEEMQAIIQKYTSWKQRMLSAGIVRAGNKLQDGTGKVLRRNGKEVSISDGPFTESKEVMGGLFEITADSFDHALEISRDCPHLEFGTIEIRQIENVGPK